MPLPWLPVTDLHRHLDGNIRTQTILDLAQQFNVSLPADTVEGLTPHVQITNNEPSLVAFLSKLDWGVSVLGNLDACRRVAYENIEDLVTAQIDYAELRFSPYYMAMKHQLPVFGVVEAVIDGVQSALREHNVKANLIGIMSRTFGAKACQHELDALLAQRQHLVAIDLAGDELGQPGELFLTHFKQVHKADLAVTVHAGEAAGAESIWQAIEVLGATRIGHGVNAIQDPKLLEYLAKHNIGIESCITSNLQTSTVAQVTQHPIKTFLEQGILACLNTDDPAVEGIELHHEYQVARNQVGLNPLQLQQAQINGLSLALLSDSEKNSLKQQVSQRHQWLK